MVSKIQTIIFIINQKPPCHVYVSVGEIVSLSKLNLKCNLSKRILIMATKQMQDEKMEVRDGKIYILLLFWFWFWPSNCINYSNRYEQRLIVSHHYTHCSFCYWIISAIYFDEVNGGCAGNVIISYIEDTLTLVKEYFHKLFMIFWMYTMTSNKSEFEEWGIKVHTMIDEWIGEDMWT